MATAAAALKPKRIKKTKNFWEHQYTLTKVDPSLRHIEAVTVTGSREASKLQEKIEDAGYFAIVFNVTTNEEEYRTPGCEK